MYAAAQRAASRMSEAKPGEDRRKTAGESLLSPGGLTDGFAGVHQCYSVLQTFVSRIGGGSKPPPYEILCRYFRVPMLQAHVAGKYVSTLFANRGRGEELPSCRVRGRRAPTGSSAFSQPHLKVAALALYAGYPPVTWAAASPGAAPDSRAVQGSAADKQGALPRPIHSPWCAGQRNVPAPPRRA